MRVIQKRSRKLTATFSLILILLSILESVGQERISSYSITLEAENSRLSEILEKLEAQSPLSFSYNPKKIPSEKKISYQVIDRPLNHVLDELLLPLGIDYLLVENQIILKKQRKKDADKTSTYSGYILDQATGEALIGATIFVEELQLGTITNQYGFFSLTLPNGSYSLSISFISYEQTRLPIELVSSIEQTIRLVEKPPILEGIIVTSSAETDQREAVLGRSQIRPQQVKERAALFGENDVIKTLESVPGIKPHSDGSTFYYVRGGDRDQNLILIDDAPIYNPSHLFGLFSTVIPDAINDVNIYKGEMPASIGGRLSSVMDIRTKKGNDQDLEVWGGTSPISTKLGVEGPIQKGASSFLLSGRFSQIGWVFRLDNDDIDQANFNDWTGKLNFKLNRKNQIFFSFYHGNDNFTSDNSGIEWANTAGTFRWTHLFSDRLFLKTTVAGSTYDYFLIQDRASNTEWKSHISNFTLKSDFHYFPKPNSEITFGLGFSGYNLNPGNLSSDLGELSNVVSIRNSSEFILYGNHELKLYHWRIKYGLRLTSWANTGDSFEYIFNEDRQLTDTLFFDRGDAYGEYFNAEPRLGVSYDIDSHSSLKASYSRNVQNLHLITNSISPFTSLEVWLPSNINIEPQTSDQLGLGYYRTFRDKGLSLEIESFYKIMTNQIDYEAHAETLLNPLIERELRFGEGRSYGVELVVKKNEGRLTGWTGYTYSRAKRKFDEINDGRTFNAFFDRPHEFNLVIGYDLNLRWHAGMNWTYITGAPFSSPVGFFQHNNQEVPIYDQKNNDRLPDYLRMDLSAQLRLNRDQTARFRHDLTFSVYNFFGRKNPFFINYHKVDNGSENFPIPGNLLDANRIPSQTFLFQFVPSIAYNFRWQ